MSRKVREILSIIFMVMGIIGFALYFFTTGFPNEAFSISKNWLIALLVLFGVVGCLFNFELSMEDYRRLK